MTAPLWIDADEIRRRVSPDAARRLLGEALASGFDPADDPPRAAPKAGAGEMLLMTSTVGEHAGVKVLSVAPGNPALGRPRIQAWYVLMDAATLTPFALLDGTALTLLRTPATTMLGVDAIAPAQVDTVVIVGSGPQSVAHAEALLAIRTPRRALLLARDSGRAESAARRVSALGLDCQVISATQLPDAVRSAQLVLCCTSSRTPVLESGWVADGACVVAIGNHDSDARELDSALIARSQIVVEDVGTALREPGEIVIPVAEGVLDPASLRSLREVALGHVQHDPTRPNVVKTVGMAWQDLVVAVAAVQAG